MFLEIEYNNKKQEAKSLENITVQNILDVTNGKLIYGNKDDICERFCKNTKEIKFGDIYIGFKGEKFDGSKFYEEALMQGAKGCITNKTYRK